MSASGLRKPGAETSRSLGHARLERPSAPDVIATVLRDAIISGAMPGGSQIRQNEVATELGVSIIPVREALRQLMGEGFVVLQKNRGAVVAEVSAEEIRELFDLRATLECLLLEQAVPNISEADYERAWSYQDALDNEPDPRKWGELNWHFHEALYRPAGRPRTMAIVENVNRHVDRHLRLQMSLIDGQRQSHKEHADLIAACRSGDVEASVRKLSDHIRGVERIILGYASQQERGRVAEHGVS